MSKRLEILFDKLGYNQSNGLYILGKSKTTVLNNFPSRISRVITEVIKPYAVFCVDNQFKENEHIKPFNNPLILFYNNPSESEYSTIAKHSFNLSRSPIIIISRDDKNSIDIFNGFEFAEKTPDWLKLIDLDHNLLSIKNLRSGKGWKKIYKEFFTNSKTVDRYLLSNITDVRRILVANENNFPEGNLIPEVANRLIGRMIFIRYLIDRNVSFHDQDFLIGDNKKERQNALNKILLDHTKTYDFFDYINQKFKGDLFPLEFNADNSIIKERDYVKQENLEVLHYLLTCSNMFVGERIKGYSVQPSLFNLYDFEIIPVELISNIYESFLGNTVEKSGEIVRKLSKQKEVKAYYTPPFLVDYVLSQTVKPFLDDSDRASCKVLDPSCGSGIFLVETLRQIIDKENSILNNHISDKKLSNQRLWELLQNNIFGIDIDENAIEITIFSLYITLLDYKTYPKEIENFEFRALKNINLFGGKNADFFNITNSFNKLFKEKVKLDFIVGNPPWGKVVSSSYKDYIKNRSKSESLKNKDLGIKLSIGNGEISQAFMLRVEDLIQENSITKVCFIVTGKNVYNSDKSVVEWRKYFLNKFIIHQYFDLFGVNNKVAGGKQIFENANQPPAIFLYSKDQAGKASENKVKHIVARANQYYHYFKTIVIEKNDVKIIKQKFFIDDDKTWKVLLYGNSLDYLFINRLRNNYTKIKELFISDLEYRGGFKSKDKSIKIENRKATNAFWNFDYIEVENSKDLKRSFVRSSKKFKDKLLELKAKGIIEADLKVPQISNIRHFKGSKLLIKKGLDQYINHGAVSAVTTKDCVFSATIAAITFKDGVQNPTLKDILYSLSAVFNSKLFTYFLFMTSSSFGAGRNRANFNEFFEMIYINDSELIKLSQELHEVNNTPTDLNLIKQIEKKVEDKLYELFEISEIESDLIDYALQVSLPIMKRADNKNNYFPSIFNPVKKNNRNILVEYCNVFNNHFGERFKSRLQSFIIDIYVNEDFVAIHFKIAKQRKELMKFNFGSPLSDVIAALGGLGIGEISTKLFVQQDVRGFNNSSFYIIKPNIEKNWHKAIAHKDLTEFIEAIAKSELKKVKH